MSPPETDNLPATRGKAKKVPQKTRVGLTELMINYCDEFASNGFKNQTAAYIRARGYEGSYSGAVTCASKLMGEPRIQARLARMKRKSTAVPFAVALEEVQRDLYDTVQITMGRKAAPHVDRGRDGIRGAVMVQDFNGLAAISALDKLAKLAGGYEKGQAASGLKVNINIDIGGQTAGPHPTVSTVLSSDKTDDKADPVVSEQ